MTKVIVAIGSITLITLIVSGIVLQEVQAKGLKVYLTVDTNLPSQNLRMETYQFRNVVYSHEGFMNNGITDFTLQYPDELIDVGDFRICMIAQSDNSQSCGNGYNSEEKKPENVRVNLFSSNERQSPSSSSSSSASSSSSSSSSSDTTVIVCPPEETCIIER